jgi:hypothetical protein
VSQGYACRNNTHRAGGRWVVVQRHSNRSAFNGGRRTPSDYSEVRCLECRTFWRTKAAYVNTLPDAIGDEAYRG